jgi:hypothetical protein
VLVFAQGFHLPPVRLVRGGLDAHIAGHHQFHRDHVTVAASATDIATDIATHIATLVATPSRVAMVNHLAVVLRPGFRR